MDLPTLKKEIAAISRKMQRSQRATNPDNYEKDRFVKKDKHTKRKKGINKKGCTDWTQSKNYMRLLNELREANRVLAARRKQEHEKLVNQVLALGNELHIEKNSFKAFQRGWFGKTIQSKAPSAFITTLKRKAEKTGGSSKDISAFDAKLSQYCHVCNGYHKKTLGERIHKCGEKAIAQRDLYSGVLALSYNTQNSTQSKFSLTKERFDTVFDEILSAELKRVMSDSKKARLLGISSSDACSLFVSEREESLHTKH